MAVAPNSPAIPSDRVARRTLVAGFGNVLRGDDGVGVEVVRRLRGAVPSHVHLMDVGTGGIRMAQELLAGYDQLIVVDALDRGAPPGTLFVLRVQEVPEALAVDAHLTLPSAALGVARTMGVLPPDVYLVGVQPVHETLDEFRDALSPAADAGATEAVRRVLELLAARDAAAPAERRA